MAHCDHRKAELKEIAQLDGFLASSRRAVCDGVHSNSWPQSASILLILVTNFASSSSTISHISTFPLLSVHRSLDLVSVAEGDDARVGSACLPPSRAAALHALLRAASSRLRPAGLSFRASSCVPI